jgi:O-antigen/teichoic acid export membrane protein
MPLIIRGLGLERFGILAISWVVMGYFALFDLGLGRATTKFVSECVEKKELTKLPNLVWNSLVAHVALGLIGGGILAILARWLTQTFFNLPDYLQRESLDAFYLLAISVPLIIATACLRGVLEAIQRFDLVNVVKIPASIINYVAPLIVLHFTNDLAIVVGVIVASRFVVLVVYFSLCLYALPVLRSGFGFAPEVIKPLIGFGAWLTVSSLITPIILFLDRFFIAAIFTLGAVTFYVTPYEVVTKLWIFSASLLAALFPVFSAMSVSKAHEIRALSHRAFHFLLFLVAPLVGILLTFGREFLEVWVGHDFAVQSTAVVKWLAVGVLINVLAQVPYTILQGIGRADIVAKLQLVQLPFYAVLVWYLGQMFGIAGVAMAWSIRALSDAVMLSIAANKVLPETRPLMPYAAAGARMVIVPLFLLTCWVLDSTFRFFAQPKLLPFALLLGLYLFWQWFYLTNNAEHNQLIGWFKQILKIGAAGEK